MCMARSRWDVVGLHMFPTAKRTRTDRHRGLSVSSMACAFHLELEKLFSLIGKLSRLQLDDSPLL
jgi:hypothetical protein